METKLCRICGKLGRNYANIFKTEGLKNKIETCLPIVISPYCLLPDTICGECLENVDNFYNFIKNCLQNIIILEAQYDVSESCLKTKRKYEKSTTTNCLIEKFDQNCQTDDFLDVYLRNFPQDLDGNSLKLPKFSLVDYDIESGNDSQSDNETQQQNNQLTIVNRRYFDDNENNLIDEIAQRKTSRKRKIDGIIENQQTKIFRMDRRKSRQPKKMELSPPIQQEQFDFDLEYLEKIYDLNNISPAIAIKQEPIQELSPPQLLPATNQLQQHELLLLPQICLLCEEQFSGPSTLASHVFEIHGIDMAQILQQQIDYTSSEKKKRLPNLVKISDLKQRNDSLDDGLDDNNRDDLHLSDDNNEGNDFDDDDHDDDNRSPPLLTPNYVCPICPSIFTINRQELVNHLEQIHPEEARLLCNQCLYQAPSFDSLKQHIEQCLKQHQIIYNNNNNNNHNGNRSLATPPLIPTKLTCDQCGKINFETYNDYSQHRRQEHSIFHCDLCNKFYGRNSHLWKHVNRVHKGNELVTCEVCKKTSASKYHLDQHVKKIHNNSKVQQQKYQPFDFQSVKQSFMRQELLEQNSVEEQKGPKEIDVNSELYTNIITNYTPPPPPPPENESNEQESIGEHKCTKCNKAFHKRTLLKKHRKNCRPRLQKDLLTRCKTCSRIFKDRQSLSKHLINYHSEYSCEICGQTVQSKCEIITHIRFTHPQNNLICKLCNNILRNQYELKVHESNHTNSYVCQFCGDCLDNKIKLKMHILSLHRKILNLSCGICLKLFENQLKLREHVRYQHAEQIQSLTTCPVCGKNYGSKWKTYDHLNKSHGRIFKACKICLEIFENEAQLLAHQQLHPNNNQQQLQQQQQQQLVKQSESDNNENNEESDDDSGAVVVQPVKKQHVPQQNSSKRTVYVNSNDPSYCEICLKTWPAKKHLWQHYIRCHKQVAATVCGICLKTNRNYLDLQKHLKQQHPSLLYGQGFGSNFICRICGRYHNASSKLKLHMAIHENFNWDLLNQNNDEDQDPDHDKNVTIDNNSNSDKETKTTNGYGSSNNNNNNDNINYDSLIEQVECSSNDRTHTSDDDKCDSDDDDDNDNDDDDSDTDDDSSTDESSNESLVTNSNNNNSLDSPSQSQNQQQQQTNEVNDNSNSDLDDDINDRDIFNTKTEELNSAIQSIEEQFIIDDDDDDDEDDDDVDDDEDDDYCDLQQQPMLNDNEIESAVGSIL